MISLLAKAAEFLGYIAALIENVTQLPFSGSTRDEVKGKIDELNKERDMIYVRYSYFLRLRRLKENGYTAEHLKALIDKKITYEETLEIYENLDALDSKVRTEQESAYANKNETVVNLFLLNEKKKYFKGKILAVFLMLISALSIVFLNLPYWTVLIGVVLFVLFEVKDQIVSYRVAKGFFGTTTSEAIELIKFIRKNIDDINSGDGGGARRKILNPLLDSHADDALTQWEQPNV